MIYYFVDPDGKFIDTEDNVKGWFDKQFNPNMRTNKRDALRLQKRLLKEHIAELQAILETLE
jgi:hypothetical protein